MILPFHESFRVFSALIKLPGDQSPAANKALGGENSVVAAR